MTAEQKEKFLLTLARSEHRERLVLRGGVLIESWLPTPRKAADLDFLALWDLDDAGRAAEALALSAGFHVESVETIWAGTEWPGLRLVLGPQEWQLDIGAGDPLVASPVDWRIEGTGETVLAVVPEVMVGWKVHGLFERGPGRWRAKDLWDLHELLRHVSLDLDLVEKCLQVAFDSRGDTFAIASRFFCDDWGRSRGSSRKWRKFCEGHPNPEISTILSEVRAYVARRLQPMIQP